MKKLILFMGIGLLALTPVYALAVGIAVSPTIGLTLSDIVIVNFNSCFDWCYISLYKSDGSYIAGPKWIYTGSVPIQSELYTGTKTVADLGFNTTNFGDYILVAYRHGGSTGCPAGVTLNDCIAESFEVNTATFTLRKQVVVSIDIKPGSYPNSVNLGSNGTVPVAIFSTPEFDATTIDPITVFLASAPVKLRRNGIPMSAIQDINNDGLPDLVIHVNSKDLGLSETDKEANFIGYTLDAAEVIGSDTIRIIP